MRFSRQCQERNTFSFKCMKCSAISISRGVITILVLGQHGLIGEVRSDIDLSYLSDTIFLFRYFEARGNMFKALSVAKSRTTSHQTSIREFRLGRQGVEIGNPLKDFEGVLSGLPAYRGTTPLLSAEPAIDEI